MENMLALGAYTGSTKDEWRQGVKKDNIKCHVVFEGTTRKAGQTKIMGLRYSTQSEVSLIGFERKVADEHGKNHCLQAR